MVIRPLSSELKAIAEKKLNEVPSRVHADINHIREWISKQPHLNARTDDQWLLSFLRGCKFSLEQTKEKLDMYYTMRSLEQEFLLNRDPLSPDIQEFLKIKSAVMLPTTLGPAGPRIGIIQVKNGDPGKHPIVTILKVMLMMLDIFLCEDDNLVIAGIHTIVDFEGFDYNYLTQFPMSLIKKSIMFGQGSYPLRAKGIHVINFPSYLEPIFNAAKMFLTKKTANRVNIYTKRNMSDLYKVIPLSILPKDYGGDECSMEELGIKLTEKVESYRDWFQEDAQYFTDETQRPGKPKTTPEMLGIEGSFRKLQLD